MFPLSRLFTTRPVPSTWKLLASCAYKKSFSFQRSLKAQLQLRDYQEECIQAVLTSLEKGSKRMGISLATGSGKTVIFTQLISRVPARSTHATRTLILAHRRELVEQAAKHCVNSYPDQTVEIEMGNMSASGTADITVASIQSIVSKDRILKYDPLAFKLVLVDEAHHIVAPNYMKTLKHFNLDAKQPESPVLVGVSATFSRFDGLRLGSAIDEIVYHKDYVDMINDKWLSNVIFTTVDSKVDISKVKIASTGDFKSSELSAAVNTAEANDIIFKSWYAKASDRRSTLIFCVDVAHILSLQQTFTRHGIDARYVTGTTPKLQRSECLEEFRQGTFPVLINCGVFTEGTDIPNIDCVILARPTKSRNLLVQMIGRGMRLHKSKTNCHIIDMVSSLQTGVVTTPTLFGLDPNELVRDASVEDMNARRINRATLSIPNFLDGTNDAGGSNSNPSSSTAAHRDHAVTFTDYTSILDLISDTSEEKHICAISNNSWVSVDRDKYILTSANGSFIRLERDPNPDIQTATVPLFRAEVVQCLLGTTSKSPLGRPREIISSMDFSGAVHGCDRYADEHFPRYFINRFQRWRRAPPTTNQLAFLNKIAMSVHGEPLTEDDIDKGKATDMITKIKHGARGRFSGLMTRKARQERLKQREAQKKQQETVSVGPLES